VLIGGHEQAKMETGDAIEESEAQDVHVHPTCEPRAGRRGQRRFLIQRRRMTVPWPKSEPSIAAPPFILLL
jgi:hypothetical protein